MSRLSSRFVAVCLLLMVAIQVRAEPAVPQVAGRSLRDWVGDLNDKAPLVREEAIEVLSQLGPAAKEAVPALQKLRQDQNPNVRLKAFLSLWKIDKQTEGLAKELGEAIQAADKTKKPQLLQVLIELGPAVKEAIPTLVELMAKEDNDLRFRVADALTRMGDAGIKALIEALAHRDRAVRIAALDRLTWCGPAGRAAIPVLLKMLKDDDLAVRLKAARALQRFDPKKAGEAIIPILLKASKDANVAVRFEAFQIANTLHPKPKELTPLFAETLKNAKGSQRLQAVLALAEIDPKNKELLLPILLESLKDKAARDLALSSLTKLGPEAKPAFSALVEVLREKAKGISSLNRIGDVSKIFGSMGPEMIPEIIKLLGDEEKPVRLAAANGLVHIGAPALPELTKALGSKDARTRQSALHALARVGPEAAAALPNILALLKDDDVDCRVSAVDALYPIGPPAQEAVPTLAEMLTDKTLAGKRTSVLYTLVEIGPASRKAIPTIKKLLNDDDWYLRIQAAEALWKIDRKDQDAIQALAVVLKDPAAGASRDYAATVLMQMETDALAAVPALLEVLKEEDRSLRTSCIFALNRIDPEAKLSATALKDLLQDKDRTIRLEAAFSLVYRKAADREVIPIFAEAIKQEAAPAQPNVPRSRRFASRLSPPSMVLDAVARLGPKTKDLLPALQEHLQQPGLNEGDYLKLAEALSAIDDKQKAAVLPRVREIMRQDQHLCVDAALMLWKVHALEEGVPTLIEVAKDPSHSRRNVAIEALGKIGPAAKSAEPALKEALTDFKDLPYKRIRTAVVLWRVTGETQPTLSVLLEISKNKNKDMIERSRAVTTIGEMGSQAKEAAPVLIEMAKKENSYVRRAAAAALEKIDPKAAKEAGR